jgi:molecular chaperone DnaK (HSP70)
LGTTFSAVGYWKQDKVVMIPNDRGDITTPSWVAFTSTGQSPLRSLLLLLLLLTSPVQASA